MNKQTILIIALVVLIGVGFSIMSKTPNTAPEEMQKEMKNEVVTAALTTSEEQFDFGTIDIFGGKVTTEFPVTNTGEEAITVLDGTTSCACTSAELEGVGFDMHKGMNKTVTIQPGETKMMSATYDPLFHGPNGTGKITREVILKTNSATTPEIRAIFKANVVKS